MGEDTSKRKREEQGAPSRSAKRANAPATRDAIAEVYDAYDALYSALAKGESGAEADFLRLLRAGEGSLATKRLAARLLPTFVRHFPDHAAATAGVVIDLATLSILDPAPPPPGGGGGDGDDDAPSVAEVAEAARADALRGLSALVEVAQGIQDPKNRLPIKLVDFCFKQLQRRIGKPSPGGELPNGSGAGRPQPADGAAEADPLDSLWPCLDAAFCAFPRIVLAACLHALKDPGSGLYGVARHLVAERLLAPPPPPPPDELEGSEWAALLAEYAGAAGAGEQAAQNGGAGAAGAEGEEGAADQPRTLAAKVLRECPIPAKYVQQFRADVLPHNGREALALLDRLLEEQGGSVGADTPLSTAADEPSSSKRASRDSGSEPTMASGNGWRSASAQPRQRSASPDGQQRQPRGAGAPEWRPQQPPPDVLRYQGPADRSPKRARLDPAAAAPMGVDGGAGDRTRPQPSQQQQGAAAAAAAEAGLPLPGGDACLAASCLYLSGLPLHLGERDVGAECARHARVECVVLLPGIGAAYVTFRSVRDAMRCYEGMAGAAPWRGCRPLDVQFCPAEAWPRGGRGPPSGAGRPATHVWLASGAGAGEEAEALRACREARAAPPEHVLRVKGQWRSGLLLSFASTREAETAARALRERRQDRERERPAPAAPPPLAPSASGVARGVPAGAPPPAKSEQQQQGEGQPRPLPPPEFYQRTLWVGQIHRSLAQEQVVAAFSRFGSIASVSWRRHSDCAFLDFAAQAAAVEARRQLDGTRLGPAPIRVEFKNEQQYWAQQHGCGSGASTPSSGGPPPQAQPPPPQPALKPPPQPPQALQPPPPVAPPLPGRAWADGGGQRDGPPRAPTGSRSLVCSVVCLDAPQAGAPGWASAEPQLWPATLDVAHRTELGHVCGQLFPATPPGARAVRRLAAADPGGRRPLADFAAYLQAKSRAGLVALPPLGAGGPGRSLYLVPSSPQACAALGVPWEGAQHCMLALVVPAAGGAPAAPAAGGTPTAAAAGSTPTAAAPAAAPR
eukprot:scaffold10.g2290.t1